MDCNSLIIASNQPSSFRYIWKLNLLRRLHPFKQRNKTENAAPFTASHLLDSSHAPQSLALHSHNPKGEREDVKVHATVINTRCRAGTGDLAAPSGSGGQQRQAGGRQHQQGEQAARLPFDGRGLLHGPLGASLGGCCFIFQG